MAKVEQDIEAEIDIPKSLKFKKTIGKIKYKLHEEEVKLIIDIKKIAKEIKCLQWQLEEANKVIKGYSKLESLMNLALGKREKSPAQKYLAKWGVK